jgi:OOP family OmpA-OmpF porin
MHDMRTLPRLTTLMLAGFGALNAAPALAQLRVAPYAYGGLSVGQSRAKVDENRIAASQLGLGLTTSSVTSDETDTAYRVFGGYQFNRNFGLEAGFFDLGKFGLNATTVPAGSLIGEIKTQGAHLDLVGTLPVTDRLSVLGRIGAHYAKTRGNFRGTGAVTPLNPIPSTRDTNPKLGVGLQYAVTSSFLVRGEVERYQVNDSVGHRGGVNVVSMSVVFPFGRAPEPMKMAVAPEPAYVAPEPAPMVAAAPPPEPAPVIVAAPLAPPAPPPRSRVSFSAESLFNFDQSNVQPEGRAALDKFANDLSGTQYDSISVEGHTDRLGKPAYNQKLSLERANAVKDHLVTTGRIDPAKITATGKGESTPVTKPGDCKGTRQTPALVTCLQPDRRVEIEVTGTR